MGEIWGRYRGDIGEVLLRHAREDLRRSALQARITLTLTLIQVLDGSTKLYLPHISPYLPYISPISPQVLDGSTKLEPGARDALEAQWTEACAFIGEL